MFKNRKASESGKQLSHQHTDCLACFFDRIKAVWGKHIIHMPKVNIHLYFHAGLTVSSWFSLAVQTDCDCQGHSGYFYAIHKHPITIIRREGLDNYLCFPSLCLCGCLYISVWFLHSVIQHGPSQ